MKWSLLWLLILMTMLAIMLMIWSVLEKGVETNFFYLDDVFYDEGYFSTIDHFFSMWTFDAENLDSAITLVEMLLKYKLNVDEALKALKKHDANFTQKSYDTIDKLIKSYEGEVV